ncbi:MAG: Xaa-Pro peptidase family protein [Pseudomonadota bacterium]
MIEAHQAACRYRLQRVRDQLLAADVHAVLLFDPINIRYASDTSNMQVWTLHNEARYLLVSATGQVVLWEFHNCAHLHAGNQQVDEIRDAKPLSFFSAGSRMAETQSRFAAELASLLHAYAGEPVRLAVDRADFDALRALQDHEVTILPGQGLMEQARLIKSEDELQLMRASIAVAEQGIERMHAACQPGTSEIELWSLLHAENIRKGGEWIETRLLNSGERTNPWMREAGHKKLQHGELLCFDTDMIGPYGYCADISRTWTVGHSLPSAAQAELYRHAYEQIQHNMALLEPGASLAEISQGAWKIPERYWKNRYSYLMHGVGMADEYPGVHHWGEDWERCGYDLILEPNMCLCVESFIGDIAGGEGVKLEQQVLISEHGVQELSTTPWNDDWL